MARILIVEDNEAVRECYSEALRLAGHEVATEADLDGALRALHACQFDAVVTDGEFPDGDQMSDQAGLTLAAACVARKIPVLLVSGRDEIVFEAWRREIDALRKPILPDRLIRWVHMEEVTA